MNTSLLLDWLFALTSLPREIRNSSRTSKNMVNEVVCIASPASNILLPVFGSFEFDSEDPTNAAPAICMMVVNTSAVMKPQSISLGDNHQRCFLLPDASIYSIVAAHAMSRFMEK